MTEKKWCLEEHLRTIKTTPMKEVMILLCRELGSNYLNEGMKEYFRLGHEFDRDNPRTYRMSDDISKNEYLSRRRAYAFEKLETWVTNQKIIRNNYD
jgi:hypothetical protein